MGILGGIGGTSLAATGKEGFQWSILVLVAASEEEEKKETQAPTEVTKNES